MTAVIELDTATEIRLLLDTFEQARNAGQEFVPMAVAFTATGRHLIVAFDSLAELAKAVRPYGANRVLVARDSWMNDVAVDGPLPEGYLRPRDDPFAYEALFVADVTRAETRGWTYRYRMESGRVVWPGERTSLAVIADADLVRKALRWR